MANRVELNLTALIAAEAKLRALTDKELAQTQQRIISGVKRRLIPEASRQISATILNLAPRQISPFLIVSDFEGGLRLSGKSARLPVSAFKPTWGGRNSPGVSVEFWRDSGAIILPHTFIRSGTKGVWQRVPGKRAKTAQTGTGRNSQRNVIQASSNLVSRLPIVQRKGPSFARAVFQKKHGDIYPPLIAFAQTFVQAEAKRLVTVLEFK